MTWICQHFDCNKQVIEDYDVLKYFEDSIKKLKKKHPHKDHFANALRSQMMYRYWSRCEYELIIEIEDNRIYLIPWSGCYYPEQVKVDVTDRTDFDWKGFVEKNMIIHSNKIDIYDQLIYKWDEFVDYCWNYHHKWQRRKKTNGKEENSTN